MCSPVAPQVSALGRPPAWPPLPHLGVSHLGWGSVRQPPLGTGPPQAEDSGCLGQQWPPGAWAGDPVSLVAPPRSSQTSSHWAVSCTASRAPAWTKNHRACSLLTSLPAKSSSMPCWTASRLTASGWAGSGLLSGGGSLGSSLRVVEAARLGWGEEGGSAATLPCQANTYNQASRRPRQERAGVTPTPPSLTAPAIPPQLKAFALDLGGSTLEDPTDLEIVVVDQNDNRPAFLQEMFVGRVLEGAAPGEAAGTRQRRGWVPQVSTQVGTLSDVLRLQMGQVSCSQPGGQPVTSLCTSWAPKALRSLMPHSPSRVWLWGILSTGHRWALDPHGHFRDGWQVSCKKRQWPACKCDVCMPSLRSSPRLPRHLRDQGRGHRR